LLFGDCTDQLLLWAATAFITPTVTITAAVLPLLLLLLLIPCLSFESSRLSLIALFILIVMQIALAAVLWRRALTFATV